MTWSYICHPVCSISPQYGAETVCYAEHRTPTTKYFVQEMLGLVWREGLSSEQAMGRKRVGGKFR